MAESALDKMMEEFGILFDWNPQYFQEEFGDHAESTMKMFLLHLRRYVRLMHCFNIPAAPITLTSASKFLEYALLKFVCDSNLVNGHFFHDKPIPQEKYIIEDSRRKTTRIILTQHISALHKACRSSNVQCMRELILKEHFYMSEAEGQFLFSSPDFAMVFEAAPARRHSKKPAKRITQTPVDRAYRNHESTPLKKISPDKRRRSQRLGSKPTEDPSRTNDLDLEIIFAERDREESSEAENLEEFNMNQAKMASAFTHWIDQLPAHFKATQTGRRQDELSRQIPSGLRPKGPTYWMTGAQLAQRTLHKRMLYRTGDAPLFGGKTVAIRTKRPPVVAQPSNHFTRFAFAPVMPSRNQMFATPPMTPGGTPLLLSQHQQRVSLELEMLKQQTNLMMGMMTTMFKNNADDKMTLMKENIERLSQQISDIESSQASAHSVVPDTPKQPSSLSLKLNILHKSPSVSPPTSSRRSSDSHESSPASARPIQSTRKRKLLTDCKVPISAAKIRVRQMAETALTSNTVGKFIASSNRQTECIVVDNQQDSSHAAPVDDSFISTAASPELNDNELFPPSQELISESQVSMGHYDLHDGFDDMVDSQAIPEPEPKPQVSVKASNKLTPEQERAKDALIRKYGMKLDGMLLRLHEKTSSTDASKTEWKWIPVYQYAFVEYLHQVWNEFYEGLDGRISIMELNRSFKNEWRFGDSLLEREYQRRLKALDAIANVVAEVGDVDKVLKRLEKKKMRYEGDAWDLRWINWN